MQTINPALLKNMSATNFFEIYDLVNIPINQAFGYLVSGKLPIIAKKHFEMLANEENNHLNNSYKLYETSREVIKSSFSASRIGLFGIMFMGTGITAFSYNQFGDEVRNDILQAFDKIKNDEITQPKLLETTISLLDRINKSFFKFFFERNNPTYMCRLFVTHGIALDSVGKFSEAQENFQKALQYKVENDLSDLVHYVYARSFRLINNRDAALIQLEQIGNESPYFRLGQIERGALNDPQIFDEFQVPTMFTCPYTMEIMSNPVQYVKNDHVFIVEQSFIEDWIIQHHNCPQTNEKLTLENLTANDDLRSSIRLWKQTRLKIN